MSLDTAKLHPQWRGTLHSPTEWTGLAHDYCPACIIGVLDTGWECNSCGFDAIDMGENYLVRLWLR